MDPRLQAVFLRQQANHFTGLGGSDVRATIHVSTQLLNEAIGAYAAAATAVRELVVTPRLGNRFDVRVKLAKPAFLPAFNIGVVIEQQPVLPANPVLVLHITGGGGLLRLAGPAVSSSGVLPPGVRLEADRLFVDLRALLRGSAQAELLDYAEQLEVVTEEGRLLLLIHARVP